MFFIKKLFIICLALIISLTSCDLSFLGEKDKTPEPELPMSETVTLAELINKEDVAYIKHRSRIFLCSNFLYATAYNVDDLFDLLIVPNLEKEFITDLADVHDQYDENYGNAFSYVKNSRYEYVEWYFYSESGKNIGILTLYPNNYHKDTHRGVASLSLVKEIQML